VRWVFEQMERMQDGYVYYKSEMSLTQHEDSVKWYRF